jgi:hypothetical protein
MRSGRSLACLYTCPRITLLQQTRLKRGCNTHKHVQSRLRHRIAHADGAGIGSKARKAGSHAHDRFPTRPLNEWHECAGGQGRASGIRSEAFHEVIELEIKAAVIGWQLGHESAHHSRVLRRQRDATHNSCIVDDKVQPMVAHNVLDFAGGTVDKVLVCDV